MSIKIDGTTVIDDSRILKNITNNTGKLQFGENTGFKFTSTSNNLNFGTPFMYTVLSGATTFTESGVAEGTSCQLLMDLSTSGHAPTFSGNMNWANGTEPTWSGYSKWHCFFHALSSSEIRASAVGYDALGGGTPSNFPGGSASARIESSGLTAETDDHESGNFGDGTVTATSSNRISFLRNSTTGSEIKWRGTGTGGTALGYYNGSGTKITTTNNQEVTIWTENTVNPDSTRVVVKSETGTVITDSGYVTSTSAGNGAIGYVIGTASRSQAMGSGTSNASVTRDVECWARKSGYADQLQVTWKCKAEAAASGSGCFVGTSNLYRWTDGALDIVSVADAFTQYEAKSEDDVHYVIGLNNQTKEIISFIQFDLEEDFYGINGGPEVVTGGHPFLTTNGWKCHNLERGTANYPDVELTELAVGDILEKYNSETNTYYQEEITSLSNSVVQNTVYLLNVGGDDSYIVDGYVVHNK